MARRQMSDIGLPFTLNGEAMTASARIRGVLAPVVTSLKLVRCPLARSYPRHFTLITRTAPVLAPATLAALPSTRSIETRSLPTLTRSFPRRFTFYVACPARSIQPS